MLVLYLTKQLHVTVHGTLELIEQGDSIMYGRQWFDRFSYYCVVQTLKLSKITVLAMADLYVLAFCNGS